MNAIKFWRKAFFVVVLASLIVSGCGTKTAIQGVEATGENEQTATAAPTVTAEPTDTPVPTATATATAEATATATPKPSPTATPNGKATVAAQKTAEADAFLKSIEPSLTAYGYTLDDGHLVWSEEEPMWIGVEDYSMSRYQPLDAPVEGNFIIQTSITWNTTGGLAGCGLFFRMDGEDDGAANQFEMYRVLNAPAWNISYYDYGRWQRSISSWVYTNTINDENDSTNVVALVVNGRNIYPYINGEKQRLVEDITLKEGLFGISATQDSGISSCIFEDTWIWAIDKSE